MTEEGTTKTQKKDSTMVMPQVSNLQVLLFQDL